MLLLTTGRSIKNSSTKHTAPTNLISARPLMGAAGAGSVAQVINSALANQPRMIAMESFFEGVGEGPTSGVWTPEIIAKTGVGGTC